MNNATFYPTRRVYDLSIKGLWVESWTRESRKPKLSLIEFLDRIGPYLFTGYGKIAKHPKYDIYLRYYGNIPMNAVWWLR